MIRQILKVRTSICLYSPLSHDCSPQLPVNQLKPDMMPIREYYIIRPSQPRLETVGPHVPHKLIRPVHLVPQVFLLNMEVSNGWMVGSVLAVDSGAILELTLQCLAEKRVEGLLLAGAYVETGYGEGDA